jgi:hypothetical protein
MADADSRQVQLWVAPQQPPFMISFTCRLDKKVLQDVNMFVATRFSFSAFLVDFPKIVCGMVANFFVVKGTQWGAPRVIQ